MFVYYLLLALTIAGYLLLRKAKPKVRYGYYWTICAIIFVVIAIRSDMMGGDTHSYRDIYINGKQSFYVNFDEPGLFVVNNILQLLGCNVYWASVIKALLCLFPIFLLIKEFASDIFSSLFLFLVFSWEGSTFLLEFSAERQCFAMALFCMFLYYFAENHYRYNIKSVICLLLMIPFHYSSVLVILLLLLQLVYVKKWVMFVACIVATLSLYYIGDYLAPMIRMAEAMDKGNYLSNFGQGDQSLISLIPFVGCFLVSLFYLPEGKLNTIWFKGYFLSTVLTAFVMPMGINISRMSAYFYFGAFVSLPWTFTYIKNRIIRYGFIFMVYGYFIYRFMHVLQIMSEQEYGMVPYQTFF